MENYIRNSSERHTYRAIDFDAHDGKTILNIHWYQISHTSEKVRWNRKREHQSQSIEITHSVDTYEIRKPVHGQMILLHEMFQWNENRMQMRVIALFNFNLLQTIVLSQNFNHIRCIESYFIRFYRFFRGFGSFFSLHIFFFFFWMELTNRTPNTPSHWAYCFTIENDIINLSRETHNQISMC